MYVYITEHVLVHVYSCVYCTFCGIVSVLACVCTDSFYLEPPLYGRILYPPSFVPSKRYSVLVYVYGGPNSQTVSYRAWCVVHCGHGVM